ncbi:hypothetical protein [Virgisporangium aliadipatigenens]|uniref:hypothetical protein n=1 Tax=Virgisporangium aliadipatigenens TaxID=741659 RepID=UPI0019407B8C|nr:hypothetical protein [Virgisporangium aliadipatigenens]
MTSLFRRTPADRSRRVRAELATAWEHLLTAAQEAGHVGDTYVARGPLARLAGRGAPAAASWRWVAAGLAAGVVIGAVTTAALTRRPHRADPAETHHPDDTSPPVPARARTAVTNLAHRAGEAAHTAAEAARHAGDKARQKATSRQPAAEPVPVLTPSGPDDGDH